MPDSFAITPEGKVLIANGMDPMFRWDGLTAQAEPAGIPPPTTAVTLSGSGIGPNVGAYLAYCRFVDKDGLASNLTPVSDEYDAIFAQGSINGIQVRSLSYIRSLFSAVSTPQGSPVLVSSYSSLNAVAAQLASLTETPVQISTTTAHGLSNGARVILADITGPDELNGDWEIIVDSPTTFRLVGPTDLTTPYRGGGTWKAGVGTFVYTNVPATSNPRVTKRQLLRNTAGQTATFYVDVETTDLSTTTLTSTRQDDELSAQEAVPLLDETGTIFANRHTVPSANYSVLAHHLGRMFGAVPQRYDEGNAKVVQGSTSVVGIGTEWTEPMEGRYLYVTNASKPYLISDVNKATQTITLSEAYIDASNPYARYAIEPTPGERKAIGYSEAGLVESWPATNALSVEEDNDDITGLVVANSFIWILEQRHIYKFTFQADPSLDGYVFLAASGRGCVNNRCCLKVDADLYMLDEQGVFMFDGDVKPLSTPIQDNFREDVGAPYRINWKHSRYFHGVHYAKQETVRWFVCLGDEYLPRHCICYNYRLERWWTEEFPIPIASSCEATIGNERVVLLGTSGGRVLKMWEGTLDGPRADAGTVRGTVTNATLLSVTDSAADFPTTGVVNSTITIVRGKGKGQTRKIVAVSGRTLTIAQPWLDLPDTTSVYQIGGVEWYYRSGWYRFVDDETQNPRRVEVVFEPLDNPAIMDMRLFRDYSDEPIVWARRANSNDADGVQVAEGSAYLEADLTKPTGHVKQSLSGHRELLIVGQRYWSLELSGVQNSEQIRINEATIEGVRPD